MKKNKSSKFSYMDRSLIERMGGKAFIIKLDSQNNIRLHNFNIINVFSTPILHNNYLIKIFIKFNFLKIVFLN